MNYSFLLFPGFKDKAVTFSYDDGVKEDLRLIEIFNKYGLKCTFNLNSEIFGDEYYSNRLTVEQAVKAYRGTPHEVAAHGARHYSAEEVSEDVFVRDVISCRERLEEIFGGIIKGFAYANGSYGDMSVRALKACGIKYARTVKSSGGFSIPENWLELMPTCHHNDPALFDLADSFLHGEKSGYFWRQSAAPRLFYLWGHAYEFNNDNNWEVIEKFARLMGEREDVWKCTNLELYDYVQAFMRLEYSAGHTAVYNPSCMPVYLNNEGEKTVAEPGKTTELSVPRR